MSYLLKPKNKWNGIFNEPGFLETSDRKPTPPYHFTADVLAPSVFVLLAWLCALNEWLLLGDLDPKTSPRLDLTPQPDKIPVRFTADLCAAPRHLVNALCIIHARIGAALRSNSGPIKPGLPLMLNLSEDIGYGKYTVVEVPNAPEQINVAKADLFLWKFDGTVRKKELITALRAIAADVTAALNVPDNDPLRVDKKKFDHRLEKRLSPGTSTIRFACNLQTTANDLPQDLTKIADAIERGEVGAYTALCNWGFCLPNR